MTHGQTRSVHDSRTGRPRPSAPDDDPYLWLEQIEGARALNFVERQNSRTLEVFGGPAAERDRDALTAIYDRPDNIPYVSRRGEYLYNLWRDANNPRGLWRRTTLEEYRRLKPSWDILLDLDQLAVSERQRLVPERHGRTAWKSLAMDLESIARRKRCRRFA